MKNFFFSLCRTAYGFVYFSIAALLLFFPAFSYACKKEFLLSNIGILGTLVLLFIIFVVFYGFIRKKPTLQRFRPCVNVDKAVLTATVLLFVAQCYIFYNTFFLTGWDAEVIRYSVNIVMEGWNRANLSSYFSTYPNNVPIFYFYWFLQKLNRGFGIFTGDYSYMCVVVVNCAINAVSCFLTYKTAKIFTSSKTALVAFCLAVFSIGFSGWSVICYSDALALLCPILCAYLYCRTYKHTYTKILGLIGSGAISAIGYFIKPQCLFLFIAAVLVECARSIHHFSFKKLLRPVVLCAAVLVIFVSVNSMLDAVNQRYQVKIDESKTLGVTHFLMMGANEQTNGVFSGKDVDFSKSFADAQQRSQANLEVFKQRIMDMNVLTHLKKKMLTTFNDGTFAWGVEGRFFLQFPEELNDRATPFIKSVYCGENQRYLATAQHFVWIAILLFSLGTVFLDKDYMHKWNISFLWIILLGFVFYEALFEVRARYIYIFVPILCVLASVGFRNMVRLTERAALHVKKCIERKKTK